MSETLEESTIALPSHTAASWVDDWPEIRQRSKVLVKCCLSSN